MWRLANSISDTCVYVGKKIQFAGIRAQVNEIWVKDQKVSCGVISKNTRVGSLELLGTVVQSPISANPRLTR